MGMTNVDNDIAEVAVEASAMRSNNNNDERIMRERRDQYLGVRGNLMIVSSFKEKNLYGEACTSKMQMRGASHYS